ncbi:MAG: GerMN domain-containing protein, partial [Ruminococcus sp.]|nr:GerMN domain-containing protein [Ruminococcus sp.]
SRSLISASTAELAPDEKPVALYFRYQDSAFLAPEPRMVVVQRNESLEKAVVQALISGPLNTELSPLFPTGSEVVSTSTQDGTLFVTLNEAFLGRYADEPGDISTGHWKTEGPERRRLCLDAMAATLTEAGLCDRVQVMVLQDSPKCHNRDQDKMNVARRTCGYIGTQFWNQGRTQEIKERVLHL